MWLIKSFPANSAFPEMRMIGQLRRCIRFDGAERNAMFKVTGNVKHLWNRGCARSWMTLLILKAATGTNSV